MPSIHPHLPFRSVGLRGVETVSPLELFFDLVFVLAVTQCAAIMAHHPTWTGIARGLVVLGLLWWAWTAYAWLTSVVDPNDNVVRVVLLAAMAALLVVALCVPRAFGDVGTAVTLVIAYGIVRAAQLVLFILASRDDPGLRHSVLGLAISSAVGVGILLAGALTGEGLRLVIWAVGLALDIAGPLFIDTTGWRLVPAHFAERSGLFVILALGESVVALGVGAEIGMNAVVIVTAVLGVAVVAALWWVYFDHTAPVAARRLATVEDVRARNEMARDAYSYLHLPMVAAIVLTAVGLEQTLMHATEPLGWEVATALAGGPALYVIAHIAFKHRVIGHFGAQRVAAAIVLLLLIPMAHSVDAVITLALVAGVLATLVVYEAVIYADVRGDPDAV